jgi:hypothetical protein
MSATATVALLAVLLGTVPALGAGSHEQHVEQVKADLIAKRERALQSLAEMEVSLKAHGLESKAVAAARNILDDMMQAAAWRDLASRTTKTREAARAALDQYLKTADAQIAAPRKQLALIKKAESEAWARANPEAAKLLEIQKRAEAAESAALNAQWQAQAAEAAAAEAQADAEQAQRRAKEAERRATDAEQRSHHAGDAFWQKGAQSW